MSGTASVAVAVLALGCSARAPAVPARALDATALDSIAGDMLRGVAALRDTPAVAVAEIRRARALDPDADAVTYLLAVAHALAGDTAALAATLDTLATRHSCLAPVSGRSFPGMEAAPAVARALRAAQEEARSLRGSDVAFSLPDHELFPEGIAYDPKDHSIFLSSLHRRMVVRVPRRGSGAPPETRFAAARRDTLDSVLGMKVDAVRRRLWIATAAEGYAENENPADTGRSAVIVYDLNTRRRLGRYPIPRPPDRLAHDLALDSAGTAYVTDAEAGTVYRIDLGSDSVAPLLPTGTLASPSGIVVTPDGRGLLVADGADGLRYIDLATDSLRRVPQPRGILPLFLDGLAIYHRSLIAIAHPFELGWVLRFHMNAAFDTITSVDVLECNDPRLHEPTTGVVAGDTLFYVGTSEISLIPRPGRPVPRGDPVDVSVMRLLLGGVGATAKPGVAPATVAPLMMRGARRSRWEPNDAAMLFLDSLRYTLGRWRT